MDPDRDDHRAAIAKVRGEIWGLDQDLKGSRLRPEPSPSRREALAARFASRCGQRTGSPSIDGGLKGMRSHRSAWLRVLERRCVPLPTNGSEGYLRDSVKRREISGGPRSERGRRARATFAGVKKRCRESGVNFRADLEDRVRGIGRVPRLADRIGRKAEETTARETVAGLPA